MRNPFGFAIVVLATASLAMASGGGEGEKKGKKKKAAKANKTATKTEDPKTEKAKAEAARTARMERLATPNRTPQGSSWSGGPGQGITFSTGDNFGITLKNYLQVNWMYRDNEDSEDENEFDIRRARTALTGHLYSKDFTFKIQNNWTSGESIKDAWFNWNIVDHETYVLGIQAGQQKTGYGREHMTSGSKLDFVDRALATQVFTNERSRGAFLNGAAMEKKLRWRAGAFNTDMADASTAADEDGGNDDNSLNWLAGVQWSSHPGQVGGNAALGDLEFTDELAFAAGSEVAFLKQEAVVPSAPVVAGQDVDVFNWNIWSEVKWEGFQFLGEFFYRSEDPSGGGAINARSSGWQLGATYTLTAEEAEDTHLGRWAFGGRFSRVDINNGQYLLVGVFGPGSDGHVYDIEGLVTYFDHGHNLKHQAGAIWRTSDPSGTGDDTDFILTIQTTLIF